MIRTVILAAGASSRMGRPKPALPLDGRGETFLSRTIRTALAAGLPEIVVVAGANPSATRTAWPSRDRRVRIVENVEWQSGQLSSLLAGLRAPAFTPIEAVVVMLVDVPLVSPETIRHLVERWRATRAPIVRPARGDEHGHPVVFDGALFPELKRCDLTAGAKTVMRAHEHQILNVAIDDPGAFEDIDTPAEYERLRR